MGDKDQYTLGSIKQSIRHLEKRDELNFAVSVLNSKADTVGSASSTQSRGPVFRLQG